MCSVKRLCMSKVVVCAV
uniref:Uncharacterized protein n=1 Tax=Anguilla anguilla TaxID=7936 RepID=A0A0E9U7Y4_ANGAN